MPDSAVLTLREEMPADSCGDFFLGKPVEGLLPGECGAEAVFNFSWEKEIEQDASGDDDEGNYPWTTTIGTTVQSTNLSTTTAGMGTVSVTPNRLATRLPPRFTPSLESRDSSFQHLLRLHMNTFNQRLSMLERNTLDMKENIQRMEEQQRHLGSQLKELIALQSAGEKDKKITKLEKSYTDMETRLSRLEGRLEILIDGFTALAQEMNKIKRVRHTSRSPQERRVLPSIATVFTLPIYSTLQPPVRIIPTETPFISRITVAKSIPTPSLPTDKPTSGPRRETKLKPAATTASAKNTTQLLSVTRTPKSQVLTQSVTTLSKLRTSSKSTSQATTRRPENRVSALTTKHVSQPSNTKLKEVEKEATITKFQLEPPSHTSNASMPDQASRKNSGKRNGHNKSYRSDAPVLKKVQEREKISEEDSKNPLEPHEGNSVQNEQKTDHNFSHKTDSSTKHTITTTKSTTATIAKTEKVKSPFPKTQATTAKTHGTTEKGNSRSPKTKAPTVKKSSMAEKSKSTSPKSKATPAKKKSIKTVKRKSTPLKNKANPAKKVAKNTKQKSSPVLDLLQLLNGGHKSSKQKKSRESSLHVVLGRLAIPIRIIPDY